MEKPLLNEQDIFPTAEVLENVLGKSYSVYEELMNTVINDNYKLDPQWNYYNDGKAWLCKVSYKKKTVFWLSVWDKFFKIGFYFTEKTNYGIESLDINEEIKTDFKTRKPNGKFLPLTVEMRKKEHIQDVLKVVEYKKSLK